MYLRGNIALREQVSSALEELHVNPNSLENNDQNSLKGPDRALECPNKPECISDIFVTRGESGDSTEDVDLNALKPTDSEERNCANCYQGITFRRGAVMRKDNAKKRSEQPTD